MPLQYFIYLTVKCSCWFGYYYFVQTWLCCIFPWHSLCAVSVTITLIQCLVKGLFRFALSTIQSESDIHFALHLLIVIPCLNVFFSSMSDNINDIFTIWLCIHRQITMYNNIINQSTVFLFLQSEAMIFNQFALQLTLFK